MVTKKDTEFIIKSYTNGGSSRQIAKILNRCPSGIRLILRKNDIEIRTRSEANKISLLIKRGKEHFNWSGGRTFHKGQVYIRINYKRVKESHYNWCIANGLLCVPKGMIIHHRDCDPYNNKPENLLMLDQGTHVNAHRYLDDLKFENALKKCSIGGD